MNYSNRFKWMRKLHLGYLAAGIILALGVFVASILMFPEWASSIRLLISLAVAISAGVVGFLANWRKAFGKEVSQPQAKSNVTIQNLRARGHISVHVGDTVIYESTKTKLVPPHEIPQPPPNFVGRQADLEELEAALQNGVVGVSLHGMAGVGKTALAMKLAQRLKSRYSDADFFLDMKGLGLQPVSPTTAMAYIVKALDPDRDLPDDPSRIRGLYYSLLYNKRALLIFDDVRDSSQIMPLIPPESCALIATSRQFFTVPGIKARNLQTLAPTDATNLILAITPRAGSEASKIAELCGYLPLALCAAASVIAATTDLNPIVYTARLQEEITRLGLVGTTANGLEISIAASLNQSYKSLSRGAACTLRCLSVLSNRFYASEAEIVCSGVLSTLKRLVLLVVSLSSSSYFATDWEPAAESSVVYLSELVSRSLLHYDSYRDSYELHDIVRIYANSHLRGLQRYIAQLNKEVTLLSRILIDKPFAVGDRLVLDTGDIVEVKEIGGRTTRIYNILEPVEVFMPNSRMVNMTLVKLNKAERLSEEGNSELDGNLRD